MFEYLGLILLGFAAGIIGSMIGLGGGFVVVPILTFFGFSPQLAASDSLFAAFSNAVASTISYAKQKRIVYSLGLKLDCFQYLVQYLERTFQMELLRNHLRYYLVWCF